MIRLAGCATPTFLIDALAAICLLYPFFSPLLSPIFTSFPLDFLFAGSVQHGRSTSFASSLAVLPASLGSSAAIAATGCAASFALIGLTSRCFVPQFAIVALLRYRLQVSFAHWTSASPVSRTARGEAPSYWARASCAPATAILNSQWSFRIFAPPSPSAVRCSVAAHCASLRVLATPALRASDVRPSLAHWAYYGLFRALRAAFVRPPTSFR